MKLYDQRVERLCNLILEEADEEYGRQYTQERMMKTVLNTKENFCLFINQFVSSAQPINAEEIERVTDSFYMGKENLKEVDYIYKTKDDKLYYLLEHQTVIDEEIGYRMLKYTINVLKEKIEKQSMYKEGKKLPQIIPIVFYTGSAKWNVSKKIEDTQEEVLKGEKKLKFEYVLIDQHEYTEEELLERKGIVAHMMLLQKCEGEEQFIQVLDKLSNSCVTEQERKYMNELLNIILIPVVGEQNAQKIIRIYEQKNKNG